MFLGAASTSVNRFLSIHLKHFPSKMATLCASSSYLSNDFHQFAFRSFFCCFFFCVFYSIFEEPSLFIKTQIYLKKICSLFLIKKKKELEIEPCPWQMQICKKISKFFQWKQAELLLQCQKQNIWSFHCLIF